MQDTAVFGPVASRRLGLSLGVDLLFPKTCNLDCLYCEVGPTPQPLNCRARFRDPWEVLRQVEQRLAELPSPPDFITVTGSGEPTLHTDIGLILRELKALSAAPLAVITNSTWLGDMQVRQELAPAQLIIPSLDAVSPEVFKLVNRPHPDLENLDLAQSLADFRRHYKGAIWLEILFIKGLNDTPAEIDLLARAVQRIRPDLTQLNTVVRPPAFAGVTALSALELQRIAQRFPSPVEIIASPRAAAGPVSEISAARVMEALRRRPATVRDLSLSLGVSPQEIQKKLDQWANEGFLEKNLFGGQIYYRCHQ